MPLRINRVEYEAARLGLFEANHGLVRELMGENGKGPPKFKAEGIWALATGNPAVVVKKFQ